MCLKRPITAPFERSEPFHLLRLMGVSVPSLHIESTDSMISHIHLSGNSYFYIVQNVYTHTCVANAMDDHDQQSTNAHKPMCVITCVCINLTTTD